MDDRLMNYVEKMSDNLGVTANHLFDVLVRQQISYAIMWIVVLSFLVLLFSIGSYKFFRYFYVNYEKIYYSNKSDTFTVIKWLLICIDLSLFLTTVIAIPDAIGALINPEYYALKDLLDQLIPKESH